MAYMGQGESYGVTSASAGSTWEKILTGITAVIRTVRGTALPYPTVPAQTTEASINYLPWIVGGAALLFLVAKRKR